jgi:hypothetical protein
LKEIKMNSGMTKSEVIGSSVGGVAGAGVSVSGSVLAISTAGSVPGLSAAGIATGVAAIGGSMIGGIIVCTGGTAILVGAGAYGGYKLVRWWQKQ